MKIAEVGVNVKCLPSKERLIEQALKSKKYYQMPRKEALELINKEIKESGLFNASKKRVKKPKGNDSGIDKRPRKTKRSRNKAND